MVIFHERLRNDLPAAHGVLFNGLPYCNSLEPHCPHAFHGAPSVEPSTSCRNCTEIVRLMTGILIFKIPMKNTIVFN